MEPYELLQRVVRAFDALRVPYLITGAMASVMWGEPRMTIDIDIVADVKLGHISGLAEHFPETEFYFDEAMIKEAIESRGHFNIIHGRSGLKVDIYVSKGTAFDRSRFARVRVVPLRENLKARLASPEDVIIKKMEYYKEGGAQKHLRDITGILSISGDLIDKAYIAGWAARLGLVDIWNAILERLGAKE